MNTAKPRPQTPLNAIFKQNFHIPLSQLRPAWQYVYATLKSLQAQDANITSSNWLARETFTGRSCRNLKVESSSLSAGASFCIVDDIALPFWRLWMQWKDHRCAGDDPGNSDSNMTFRMSVHDGCRNRGKDV